MLFVTSLSFTSSILGSTIGQPSSWSIMTSRSFGISSILKVGTPLAEMLELLFILDSWYIDNYKVNKRIYVHGSSQACNSSRHQKYLCFYCTYFCIFHCYCCLPINILSDEKARSRTAGSFVYRIISKLYVSICGRFL